MNWGVFARKKLQFTVGVIDKHQLLGRYERWTPMNMFLPPVYACTLTLFSLKYLPLPYLWVSASCIIACLIEMLVARREAVRAVWLNIAVLALALGGAEGYAYFRVKAEELPTYTKGYWVRDDILGVVPVKGVVARSKHMHGATVIYDVTYSIGPDGLRISPFYSVAELKGCVLFFGCSFTFGEGLNDNQTLPYQVGVLSHGGFRTHNFAFHGYGLQQMLAALEYGLVDNIVHCRPTHIIYQAHPDHVARAAGLYSWGRHGPRFILSSDGSVKQRGHFDDEDLDPSPLGANLRYQLSKSYLLSWLAGRGRPVRKEDVRLFVGIISEARQLVLKKFPGCQFHVLLWPWRPQLRTYTEVLEGLKNAGVRVHLIHDILPDYTNDPVKYEISPFDHHPNTSANKIIAEYVVKEILGMKN